MAAIKPGRYTVQELLDAAGFDLLAETGDEATNDVDRRRVRIGGLPFDDEDKVIEVPVTTDELVVTLDGKVHTVLDVDLDDEHKAARAYSFEHAADTDAPAPKTSKTARK